MYDHSKKIGNKGDLIKHFALTTAVRQMATGQESFSYLDVHSGRSSYDLPPSGEWKTGIGKLAEHCQSEQLTEELQYYCDVQSIIAISHTRRYSGSSQIIFNVLQDLEVKKIKLILCDTNPEVCNDLENEYQGSSSVEICCTDGYQKAQDTDAVDLVFIDPPDIKQHYQPFIKLLRHCISNGKHFISWNPLHGNVPQKTMSRNCQSIVELAEKEQIPSVTTRWTSGWCGQMCGCQILFFIPQGNRVADACDALISLMGWYKINV